MPPAVYQKRKDKIWEWMEKAPETAGGFLRSPAVIWAIYIQNRYIETVSN